MHVRRFTLTAVLVVSIGLVGTLTATADDDGGDMTLWAREARWTDLAADGTDITDEEERVPAVGDTYRLFEKLYADRRLNRRVGTNDVLCTVNDATGSFDDRFAARLLCEGVVRLRGRGDLSWQGLVVFDTGIAFDPEAPFATLAITGGTGGLVGARGQAHVFETARDRVARYEVELG